MANLIPLTGNPSEGTPQEVWVNADHIMLMVPTSNGTEIFLTEKSPGSLFSNDSITVKESPKTIRNRTIEERSFRIGK